MGDVLGRIRMKLLVFLLVAALSFPVDYFRLRSLVLRPRRHHSTIVVLVERLLHVGAGPEQEASPAHRMSTVSVETALSVGDRELSRHAHADWRTDCTGGIHRVANDLTRLDQVVELVDVDRLWSVLEQGGRIHAEYGALGRS